MRTVSARMRSASLVDLGDAERLAADLVVAHGVDEVARPDEQQQLAEVDLGDEHAPVAAQDVLGVGGERVEVAQVGVGDRAGPLPAAARRRTGSRRRSSPSRGSAGRRSAARRPRAAGCPWRCRRPCLAQELHPVVVVGVVADVARDVGLLEPPMRCSRPAVPGTAHGRASVSGSRSYGRKGRRPGRRCRPRCRAGRRVAGSSTARSRWPGTRRTGRRPGSCT